MNRTNLMALPLLIAVLLGAGCNPSKPLPNTSDKVPAQNTDTEQVVPAPATTATDVTTSTQKDTIAPTQKPIKTASDTLPKGPITIYVGTGCPHCEKVEARAQETGMDKKLPIIFKEVFNNMDNAEEFMGVAKQCGLDLNNLGVPVMWDGKKCTLGDPDITKFIDLATLEYAK